MIRTGRNIVSDKCQARLYMRDMSHPNPRNSSSPKVHIPLVCVACCNTTFIMAPGEEPRACRKVQKLKLALSIFPPLPTPTVFMRPRLGSSPTEKLVLVEVIGRKLLNQDRSRTIRVSYTARSWSGHRSTPKADGLTSAKIEKRLQRKSSKSKKRCLKIWSQISEHLILSSWSRNTDSYSSTGMNLEIALARDAPKDYFRTSSVHAICRKTRLTFLSQSFQRTIQSKKSSEYPDFAGLKYSLSVRMQTTWAMRPLVFTKHWLNSERRAKRLNSLKRRRSRAYCLPRRYEDWRISRLSTAT